jgi:hypothetical protein
MNTTSNPVIGNMLGSILVDSLISIFGDIDLSGPSGPALMNEDGTYILNEDGSYILLEG